MCSNGYSGCLRAAKGLHDRTNLQSLCLCNPGLTHLGTANSESKLMALHPFGAYASFCACDITQSCPIFSGILYERIVHDDCWEAVALQM